MTTNLANELFRLLYPELYGSAERKLRREKRELTLEPAALVNEAWLRLAGLTITIENTAQFFALVTTTMDRILIDRARQRNTERHGAHSSRAVLDSAENLRCTYTARMAHLQPVRHELRCLTHHHPRAAAVIRMRFYWGMTEDETAAALRVTRRTVSRDWELAKDWLRERL